jgi:hypothetical protein
MLRRLYLEFPNRSKALKAVAELNAMDIHPRHIHTIAAKEVDTSGLPAANQRQRSDSGAQIEHIIWNLNLVLFFIAFTFLFMAMTAGSVGIAFSSVIIMAASFGAANYFNSHVPHFHLKNFESMIRHGEILLLVDLPIWQVSQVEQQLHHQHPEMIFGGMTWTNEALHI